MQGIKRRRRLDVQTWREVLRRYEQAGVTVGEFCKRERLCVSSFYRWRSRVEAGAPTHEIAEVTAPQELDLPAGFVELGSIERGDPVPRLDVRLDLGGGLVVHIVRG